MHSDVMQGWHLCPGIVLKRGWAIFVYYNVCVKISRCITWYWWHGVVSVMILHPWVMWGWDIIIFYLSYSLQNKIWNLRDQSTILPKFKYDKEGKLAGPTQILLVRFCGPALILKTVLMWSNKDKLFSFIQHLSCVCIQVYIYTGDITGRYQSRHADHKF